MALQTFLREYMQMPIVTRVYATACVVTTVAVHLEVVSPFQLYYNPTTVIKNYQLWRLVTTFLYFGQISFSFFFNLVFTYRYCRMLEEGSFRNRSADFVMMFLFGGALMLLFGTFVNLLFLGQAFTIMLVYVWSRRNPLIRMNFFGIFEFEAPYLPYVLLGFSVVLGNTVVVDIMGMVVGHIYYFFEDVFPNSLGGYKLIKTPQFLKNLLDEYPEDPDYTPLEEDRPGGFNWGAAGGVADFAQNNQGQAGGAGAGGVAPGAVGGGGDAGGGGNNNGGANAAVPNNNQ